MRIVYVVSLVLWLYTVQQRLLILRLQAGAQQEHPIIQLQQLDHETHLSRHVTSVS